MSVPTCPLCQSSHCECFGFDVRAFVGVDYVVDRETGRHVPMLSPELAGVRFRDGVRKFLGWPSPDPLLFIGAAANGER